MTGTTQLKTPVACTEAERQGFARLVRLGFHGSDEGLNARIRRARQLACYHAADGELVAIAGLKAPPEQYRTDVFRKASAGGCDAHPLELGWVYVLPAQRGRGLATRLCELLLAEAADQGVFATTRSDNQAMIRILRALGFSRVGQSYPRRSEMLALFLRPAPMSPQDPLCVGAGA